jgi:pimeloyl-ACP methyl ester carboxylesterase
MRRGRELTVGSNPTLSAMMPFGRSLDEEDRALADIPAPQFYTSSDGIRLAYRVVGDGSPVVMLHGLFSNGAMNWFKFGHVERVVAAGFQAIVADLRAHGDSEAPHDPAAYPDDVLARDAAELVAHLGLESFDLVGFSLGARTAVRAVIGGMRPRRLVLGGMGLEGLAGWTGRSAFFQRAVAEFETAKRGDDTWLAIQFMKSMKVDRVAIAHLLTTFTDTPPEALAAATMPTLLVCGVADQDNGSAARLASAMPNAHLVEVPGTHMSSVTEAALGEAIVAFLAG